MKIVVDVKNAQNILKQVDRIFFNCEKGELFDTIISLDCEVVPQIILERHEYNMIKGHL